MYECMYECMYMCVEISPPTPHHGHVLMLIFLNYPLLLQFTSMTFLHSLGFLVFGLNFHKHSQFLTTHTHTHTKIEFVHVFAKSIIHTPPQMGGMGASTLSLSLAMRAKTHCGINLWVIDSSDPFLLFVLLCVEAMESSAFKFNLRPPSPNVVDNPSMKGRHHLCTCHNISTKRY